MSEQKIGAEQVAGEMRWFMSNRNSDLSAWDIAYNAWDDETDPNTFVLTVEGTHAETGEHTLESYTVTVTPKDAGR